MAICDLCSGSGRDIVTPATRSCMKCGGSGQIFDMGTGTPARPRSGPRAGASSGGGGGGLILGAIVLAGLFVVGGGYVVASEMVWHHWAGARFTEHDWLGLAAYAGASLAAVAVAARLFGFLAGAAVGVIPALPLYHATAGGVGFWFIVLHGEEDPLDNVATSWIAFVGMLAIHGLVAWAVQRREESFAHRLLRWRWLGTPAGMIAAVVLAVAAGASAWTVTQAVDSF